MHDHHTDGPFDDGDITELPTGLSRRQTLQGMAWAAPAILVATSVPARSASGGGIPAKQGARVYSLDSRYWISYWVGERSAVVLTMNLQNEGLDAPDATSVTLTLQVPVAGEDHAWGIGGTEGIGSGEQWTLASYSRANGIATLVLTYTGGPLARWGVISLSNLWFATSDTLEDVHNATATAIVNATYATGETTTRVTTDKIKSKK